MVREEQDREGERCQLDLRQGPGLCEDQEETQKPQINSGNQEEGEPPPDTPARIRRNGSV